MKTKGNSRHPRIKLTYANAVATLALFLALGGGAVAATHVGHASVGTAQLKPSAVTGAKVKDGSLTGADVAVATLGEVPTAGRSDTAASADRAVRAQQADTAGHADTASRADTAGRADSADRAGIAASLTDPEETHFLGDPGEPAVGAGVQIVEPVGFYRDHEGVVHLQGRVTTQNEFGALVGLLPAGFRPGTEEVFFGVGRKAGVAVWVFDSGVIDIFGAVNGETVSLSGLTWRAYDGPLA